MTALNPKSITFFVAFLPAFLDPQADFLTQMLVFETTFLALAFTNAFGYALVTITDSGFSYKYVGVPGTLPDERPAKQ